MTTNRIIPTPSSTLSMINDYALAIATDDASDSTLDDMQFNLDCILFPHELDADDLADSAYEPLTQSDFADSHIADIDALRAYATAAFNLRP
jgi:hypothetical protein